LQHFYLVSILNLLNFWIVHLGALLPI
jgi:hypothetical protein